MVNQGKLFIVYLIILSFLEGASVMVCELLGGMILTPVFGSSLPVWGAVLGITLLALMAGYFLGGYISVRTTSTKTLHIVLLNAGFFLFLMPYSGAWIIGKTVNMSLEAGSVLSLMVFMFIPLMCMGMTSPIIIKHLTNDASESGRNAGLIYAVSTVGGIISTLLVGFYFISEFGITSTAVTSGLLLATVPLLSLMKKKYFTYALYLVAVALVIIKPKDKPQYGQFKIVYQEEGLLGQLKVVDHYYYSVARGWMPGRSLLVNNTAQTIMDRNNPEFSLWDYSYYFPAAASKYPKGSDALLLGMGGGTLINQFNRLGFNLDVVEIDERVRDVAIRFFSVDPETNVIIDDARHYVKTTPKQYDVVTFDLYLSESPPVHLLTKESFKEVGSILKPGGLLMVNFYGFIKGENGRAARSLYKTLGSAGYHTKMVVTPGEEQSRNLIFLASIEQLEFTGLKYTEPNLPVLTNFDGHYIDPATLDFSDAMVITDNKNSLEKIYSGASKAWRIEVNKMYTSRLMKDNIPMFH